MRIYDGRCNLRVKPQLTIAFYLLDQLRCPIIQYWNKLKLGESFHKYTNLKGCAQSRAQFEGHTPQRGNPNLFADGAVQAQKRGFEGCLWLVRGFFNSESRFGIYMLHISGFFS